MPERSGVRWGYSLIGDPTPDGDARLAAEAEELGYTDLWNGEVTGGDGVVTLTAAAAATRSARLGTAILNVYSRSPLVLAMTAASLSDLSCGRFCLGIGSSSPGIVGDLHGIDFDRPYTRVRESVQVVRDLLAGQRVSLAGRTVQVKRVRLQQPPAAVVPIYIAGLGPRMLALAGEAADGAIINFIGPDDIRGIRSTVDAAADRAGRPQPEIVARLLVPYPGDDANSLDVIRHILATYAEVPVYRALLERLGFAAECRSISAAMSTGDRRGARRAVSDRMLTTLAAVGSPEEQYRTVRRYVDAGVDVPVLAFFSASRDAAERRSVNREAMTWFARRANLGPPLSTDPSRSSDETS